LELGGIGPAPFAAMMLADLGAEVVAVTRVDDPVGADPLAQGKRRVPLDLRHPDGVAAALDLVSGSQILIEGFRPGTAERLGLGPEDCWRRSPALVYGRMTGWGQSGPLAATAGHDINYIGLTGALHAIGRTGQPPSIPLYLVGDLGGGAMFLVAGVLAALHVATATGTGRVVDAAIVDGAARLMTPAFAALAAGDWVDERGVNLLDSGRPWYDVYATSDGKWMSVGAIEDRFYAELVRVLELPTEFAGRDDPAAWPALRAALAERFAARTRAEWERIFTGVDACVAPVLSLAEAPDHPHLRERGTFTPGDGLCQDGDGASLPGDGASLPGEGVPAPAPAPRITAAP